MTPRARRILIPIAVGLVAVAVVSVGIMSKRSRPAPSPAPVEAPTEAPSETPEASGAGTPSPDEAAGGPSEALVELRGLVAVAPATGLTGHDAATGSLGSLDPAVAAMRLEFSRAGAGLERIAFSDVWETAGARRQAAAARSKGTPPPDESLRYVLQETQALLNRYKPDGLLVPALAAIRVEVNGVAVNLFDYNRDEAGDEVFIWAETGPGVFETVIVDETDTPVLRIRRRFVLHEHHEVTVEQRLENLTSTPLEVRWCQYGPPSLRLDRSRYMDRRRFRFGYLPDATRYPGRDIVLAEDQDLLLEQRTLIKRWKKAEEAIAAGDSVGQQQQLALWPNDTSRERKYELAWFGATNRYFGLAVHPVLDADGRGSRSLAPVVDTILLEVSAPDGSVRSDEGKVVFTYLLSPTHTVAPGGALALDLGVFAGPLDRHLLGDNEPYAALAMQRLILYQMSSFCAVCTFQWLAVLLLGFLTALKSWLLFDWGLAIIGLVIVVRGMLHPLTKRSQISMQRFSRQMTEMKPELDKLKAKYGDDPKKFQQEQMRLMREKGANPLQMLGCLPMFLQMPIWVALYAMLYFAFDLRQEPAFFGLFQKLGGWPFLADLSAADHFFGELSQPTRFFMWNVTGINLLPILMGVIFFIQQKYMSPPPSPTMTKEQLQQQKIMKVMMVGLFPLMLYSAPSGLTLYILTSSCFGILESKYVRSHIKEMDLNPPKPKTKTKTKPKDAQGRAFAESMKRMEEKKKRRQAGPEKRYKKRR